MKEAIKVFGGSYSQEKYISLMNCFESVEALQNILVADDKSLQDTLCAFSEKVCALYSLDACVIYVCDEDEFEVIASNREKLIGLKADKESGGDIHAKALQTGKPISSTRKISNLDIARIKAENDLFFRSSAYFPIYRGNKPFGTIVVHDKKVNNIWETISQADMNVLNMVFALCTSSIVAEYNQHLADRQLRLMENSVQAIIHDLKSPTFCLQKSFKDRTDIEETLKFDLDLLFNRVCNGLDINRIRNGKLTLDKTFIKINEILQEVIKALKTYQDYYKVTIDFRADKDDSGFDGDYDYSFRIFENILTNAIKHASAENGGAGSVIVKVEGGITDMTVSIEDTGEGIPDSFKRLVFDKYTTLKSVKGSSGLGLTFCKFATEEQGGRISVRDNTPKGTIFEVIFPYFSSNTAKKKKTILDVVKV